MNRRPSLRLNPLTLHEVSEYARARQLPLATAIKKLVDLGLDLERQRGLSEVQASHQQTVVYLLCELLAINRLMIDGRASEGHAKAVALGQHLYQSLQAKTGGAPR